MPHPSNESAVAKCGPVAGTLYVVGTPIGNLEDISLRALRVLKEVDRIAAEDTRVTRKLLSHYDIHTPLTSFHQHSHAQKAQNNVDRILAGENMALVSDAGMPSISDPGSELIELAISAGIRVIPIPGPNAALAGLVASGLPAARFAFEGFPPRTRTDRREFFCALEAEKRTIVLYESPGRLLATLEEIRSALGNRQVAICREMTKLFEEIFRGDIASAICHFKDKSPRGEFTIVIGPGPKASEAVDQPDVEEALKRALESGSTSRDAILTVAKSLRIPRRTVYQAKIKMSGE
jgi:16S rRNA (cytidine1402-2'-O)-methyltransferase